MMFDCTEVHDEKLQATFTTTTLKFESLWEVLVRLIIHCQWQRPVETVRYTQQ